MVVRADDEIWGRKVLRQSEAAIRNGAYYFGWNVFEKLCSIDR
jgi:hypothetical protein